MSAAAPRFKGTGLVPVVSALKGHPRGPRAVPGGLAHYLDRSIVATEWYPVADYFALILALAGVLERDGMADVWSHLGRTGALRDLHGSQDQIPPARRARVAGLYRRFADGEVTNAATAFQRLPTLWTLYHDTGRPLVGRDPSDDCGAIVRILDFRWPCAGMVHMQTVYFCEYARLLGTPLLGRVLRSTCAGDPFNEWQYTCERNAQTQEALSQLPLLF